MLLNGEVIWQASDSSLSKELHASILLTKCSPQIVEFYARQSVENCQSECFKIVGPGLTEFRIDRMAFSQSERTCLSIQNVPLL